MSEWPRPPRTGIYEALETSRARLARDCELARWCGVADVGRFLCRLEQFDARTHAFELRMAAEEESALRRAQSLRGAALAPRLTRRL